MPDQTECDILIVGAGFSGLIMALEARRRGFGKIVILEKADDIGGTWRENTYPGVACDIPSHLYSMARHPNPDWSSAYAGGAEIWAYLRRVARDEGLYELCHFEQTLKSARWDGTRWQVETEKGAEYSTRVLVSALGPLHVPRIPKVAGADSFPGPAFHSAGWDHGVDLAGKRVAVVGTGASAIQFVPQIARQAAHVTVFQRTAPYVMPRADGPIAPWMRTLHQRFPLSRALRRWLIYRMFEARHAVFRGRPRAVHMAMEMWRKTMEKSITDPALRKALTPPYRIGCKRILSSNDWYPALTRDNVTVIPSGVAKIEGDRLIAEDGTETRADVLIWGTGFHVTDAMRRMRISGEGGKSLARLWVRGMQAHLGTALAGFPNLFFMLGPHTGLGHNSVVLMAEAQAEHIGRLLEGMRAKGIAAVAPRAEAQEAFEAEMDARLASSVWQTGGCTSWYQDHSGRNPTLWPGTAGEYRKRMARAGLDQYRPVPVKEGD
ncbi:flavin-containing monooxygenase [Antarcticimicrobium luteum]|uniref:NAD(P)/FAD-dependent oxidoreductase n=1 Tax=Antarcticimicrobium luteum TaxID=2547397 RepID=A0A4R5UX19_9RHOB|nr:NAD(P)/FAD-dependent oxidoreductase [Antarcticimicrobium luteum]TDK43832.1 NAD(P)/FAD-dependent oxidoreductase [Antarcticimicrobium luteum]